MKKSSILKFFFVMSFMAALFVAVGAFAPVQAAAGPAQAVTPVFVTPVPGNGGPAVTVVVPNTGGTPAAAPGFFLSGWTLLILLGVVIVVLLIALLARGSDRTL